MIIKTASLTFNGGGYHYSLQCYHFAKAWLEENGLLHSRTISGTLNHPEHAQCPRGERIVPPHLEHAGGWHLIVDICFETEEDISYVRSLTLPPGARLVFDDDKGIRKPASIQI